MVLAKLAASNRDLAARALRRHRAWRDAVERGAGARAQRSLRRAWERARDDALIALAAEAPPPDASARSNRAA
jgi:DNA-binding GntR family transcriptional regulator